MYVPVGHNKEVEGVGQSVSGILCSQVEIPVEQWAVTCPAPLCKTTWWFSTAPRCLRQAQLLSVLKVT